MTIEPERPLSAPALFDQFRTDQRDTAADQTRLEAGETGDPQSPPPELVQNGMPQDARRALVLLLRLGVVSFDTKRIAFEALCRHQALIDEHLENMFMHMLLDIKSGVAILLQQESADEHDSDEASGLINKRTLSLYDTLLLLVLRKYYQERETAGEQKIIIDIDRIEALMTPFLPLTYSSRSERRTLSGSLGLLKDKRLINPVRGDDERFEITVVIRYVVNADFLERLLDQYQKLAKDAGMRTDDEVQDA
jgi:hypothetical protein